LLRPIAPSDADAILAIQAESPQTAQWSRSAYESLTQQQATGWVAETADRSISGFLTGRQVGGDMEILNFAVRPAARRQRVGTLLLDKLLARAREMAVENVYLEVRASNDVARKFYERQGFIETGRRPRYYSAPVEDAVLLTLSLSSKPSRG
jgi:ribosomal-protein-alanine N-acetyltransferase